MDDKGFGISFVRAFLCVTLQFQMEQNSANSRRKQTNFGNPGDLQSASVACYTEYLELQITRDAARKKKMELVLQIRLAG